MRTALPILCAINSLRSIARRTVRRDPEQFCNFIDVVEFANVDSFRPFASHDMRWRANHGHIALLLQNVCALRLQCRLGVIGAQFGRLRGLR
jgi:hypothetical protein